MGLPSSADGKTVADRVAERLGAYLGPHTGRVAVKTFSQKALGRGPETLKASDIPALEQALRPMLRTLLGGARAELVLAENPKGRRHMTYRKLAAFPFVWGGLFLAVLLVVPAESRLPYFRVGMEASKALAAAGCFVAAYTFDRGDYMRRAWTFNAWCYLLLLSRDTALGTMGQGHLLSATGAVLALAANLSSVLGTLLLARAWSIAGLEFPGSRVAKAAVVVVTAVFAIGVSGTDLVLDSRAVLGGDLGSLHGVASDVGDVLSLCLLAPMILTVVGMSGGVLKWPWGLLTVSLVFWLLFDAAATVDHFAPGHEATTRLAREVFRALACATECAAGLAQRRVVLTPVEAEAE